MASNQNPFQFVPMTCPNCGVDNEQSHNYCRNCGATLNSMDWGVGLNYE